MYKFTEKEIRETANKNSISMERAILVLQKKRLCEKLKIIRLYKNINLLADVLEEIIEDLY